MLPHLALSPTVSISSLKQHDSGSNPRFTLRNEFKILSTYKSAASHMWHYSAAVSHHDMLFKNCNVMGDSPMANGRLTVGEACFLIEVAVEEQMANGDYFWPLS